MKMFKALPALLVLITLASRSGAAPAPRQTSATPVQRVIQVSLDGMGAIYLRDYLDHAPEVFPTFTRLRQEGACTFNARNDHENSVTLPNHTDMITGRPVYQPEGMPGTVNHGFDVDVWALYLGWTIHTYADPEGPYKASVFDVAHDHGLSTALYATKVKFEVFPYSYGTNYGAPDLVPPDNGPNKVDFSFMLEWDTPGVMEEVIYNLNSDTPFHYLFLHLYDMDVIGHLDVWGSETWSNGVIQVDYQLGRILEAIETNPVLAGTTALLITADHGGYYDGHADTSIPEDYTIPFFAWGPSIPPGVDLYSLFANRADPGTDHPDHTVNPQPIRNGDAANFALALLGLPPVPGSFFRPLLTRDAVRLSVRLESGGVVVSWPTNAAGFKLEAASLLAPNQWVEVTDPISVQGANYTYSTAAEGMRFFRLVKRAD